MSLVTRGIGWMALGITAGLSLAWGEEALVWYGSFDGFLNTPAEARAVGLVPGRFGQAVHVPLSSDQGAGTLSYDVSRLMDPRKGTLAFWVKSAVDLGPRTALGRLADIRSEEEGYFHTWLRVSVKGKGDFTFQIFDLDAQAHGFSYTEGLQTWKAHEWHHVAVVWHCLQGIRVYDNGRQVFSSWGQDHWEPLTPTRLGLGCVPGSRAQADLWFDEARLYTEPLETQQVMALARGEDIRGERKAERFLGLLSNDPGEKLRGEVEGQPGLPLIHLGRPATVRQLLVKSAQVRKVTQGALYDGESRGRRSVSGPIDVQFLHPSRITHLACEGANVAARLGPLTIPPGRLARIALEPPLTAGQMRIETHQGGPQLTEMRFYEVGEGWRGPEGERLPLLETEGPRLDRLGPILPQDTAFAAVSLDLQLAPPWPRLARFLLTEDAERSRELFSADVRLAGEGPLQVTLDWPDYLIWAGGRLVATLIFDVPARIAAGSSLILHPISPAQAREEYVARQLGWFAPWYSRHAEAHVWDSAGWEPSSMPELRWLENVRHVAPDHPLANAYFNRIFHHTRPVEVTLPGPPEAPLWARAEREALRRTADVVHWWIDHRQSGDGQFGGHWNDDVELLHGWDLLVLGTGDEKVRESMARLCDGIWTPERFTHGYSNQIWDVEHAAEDSTYSQPRMVPLDYGNPKWLERCMETIRNFDFWTAVNPQGHRHFRSYMFQARQIRSDPETYSDVPDNARAAKIGLYVLWYNGNQRVRQWFREWADAWCEDCFKPVPGKPLGVLPGEIVWRTCQIGRKGSRWDTCKRYPLGAITYHMEDQLVGVYHATHDPKYLRPIEAQIRHGRAAEATLVNWRRLTQDAQFDPVFLQQAEEGELTPSFLAWLANRDKGYLERACIEAVRDFERNRFLLTEAEPPTDRVPLPGNVLLRQMLLGGIGVWVCGWPQMAVSWERTGLDFAALVLEGGPTRLRVLAYNFGPRRGIVLRVWELERGTYQLLIGPDANRDDALDEARIVRSIDIDRATRIPLELPARELTVIELHQTAARPAGPRPDLALSTEDVELSADRRTVMVTVHNIGSAPGEDVTVMVRTATGEKLGAARIDHLLPPDDLRPKTVRLTLPLLRPAPPSAQVVIDPRGQVEEITKENNTAQLRSEANEDNDRNLRGGVVHPSDG